MKYEMNFLFTGLHNFRANSALTANFQAKERTQRLFF